MVLFSVAEGVNSADLVESMKTKGIVLRGGPHFRAVTHYWITPEKVQFVLDSMRDYMAAQITGQSATLGNKVVY
jgi:hypothetical protein